MSRPLIPFWIEPRLPSRSLIGIGVTAFSLDDAIDIIRGSGLGECLPENLSEMRVVENVGYNDLDKSHVQPNMGPLVVRGLWYPFLNVGPPHR